jgi:hypothetical protein
METVSDPSIAMAESKWRRDMIDDRNDRPAVGDIAGAKRDRSEDGDRFAKRGIRQILGTMMMLAMMATSISACSTANSGSIDSSIGGGSPAQAGFVRIYDVCFDGFAQQDMLDVEDYLTGFSNYVSHRVTRSRATRTCYAYESGIAQARLNRNLIRMLEHGGWEGHVNASANRFEVVNIAQRRSHPTESTGW